MNATGLRARAAIVALAVAALLCGGATGAAAVWTVQAQSSSSASTASLGLAQTWLSGSSLDHTYSLTATAAAGAVTLTNTGSRAGTASVTVTASSGPAALRSAVAVEVGIAATCSATASFTSSTTGTLDSGVTFSTSLAAGASVTVCARTSMTSVGIVANASSTVSASVAAALQMGTWTASAPPTAFSQTVLLSPATVDPTGWYWLWTALDATRCIEALNPAQPSMQSCADLGPATETTELWQFATTTAGAFTVVSKSDPSTAWAFSTEKAGQALKLDDKTRKIAEFSFIALADGYVQLALDDAPGLCLQVTTTSRVAGSLLHLATCDSSVTAQKFGLQRHVEVISAVRSAGPSDSSKSAAVPASEPTPEPMPAPQPTAEPTAELTAEPTVVDTASSFACVATSANGVSFSWTNPAAAPSNVSYRVFIDGTTTPLSRGGTLAEPAVHLAAADLAPSLADGSHTVEVQHSIDDGPWATTGIGALRSEAATPRLVCG